MAPVAPVIADECAPNIVAQVGAFVRIANLREWKGLLSVPIIMVASRSSASVRLISAHRALATMVGLKASRLFLERTHYRLSTQVEFATP